MYSPGEKSEKGKTMKGNYIMKNRNTIFTTILLVLGCLALLPGAQAVTPAPDGGYPGNNTAEGDFALLDLTTGNFNTAIGFEALASNTTGNQNTATGSAALFSNTTGGLNTATGAGALVINTTGNNNTADGVDALSRNTTGNNNTAIGAVALFSNTTGAANTANGVNALGNNTTGNNNTANGFNALSLNTTGNFNTANGVEALTNNTTGVQNTANGALALFNNTTSNNNTADGFQVLINNTTGSGNTAIGHHALFNNSTGSSNIALGKSAGLNLTTGSNNIDIGNVGVAAEANTIRVGKVGTQQATFIAAISGKAVPGGVSVIVGANGHVGTVVSSQRFKTAIKPMEQASEAILALKPVTFRYKHELDPEGIPQFGLVAEEVEKVNPALVARDDQGKVYTVRYEAVNAMLLNEFLKEHRIVQEQGRKILEQRATITELKKGMETVVAHLKEQAAQIQKVSAQLAAASPSRGGLEVSKPATQMVLNNP
jgi:hypothetical protein